ncbi:NAD(P)-dependent malic enzyme [Alkalibacter saccharofermentans]|uniref:Malate dehydrogenase (Oxaloacetate-decarboxylating) n=1 Tax=Alkalibacter saccharofermentans DSM 14828 TaxID=1120975 RepID=A0A1M4Z3I9_9FIRM|nr:NADP-dependent malic enzyme [Alkalibacter saccharofermentans]SHF12619.1 malate dehydrogenase (oxaloacetate-decarboxylating) [Alkalibacter saccharofermentans DSM 14828]
MDYNKKALEIHEEHKGKISVVSKVPVKNQEDLSVAYTPGVAAPCLEIYDDKEKAYNYTSKGNLVAVVSDGSAVLGLGNIGGLASMPVMEGKAILFKEFAGVDAFPICLDTQDVDEIVQTVSNIAPTFGGINLEDISAPRCFEVEERLIQELDIPVFHDDQHGTAIVTLAAMINALRICGKTEKETKVVINGAGSAGVAIAKLIYAYGFEKIVLCDSKGIISSARENLDQYKKDILSITNKDNVEGSLSVALKGADIFIGVSAAGALKEKDVRNMNPDPVIFAMANPVPEIMPDEAYEAGALIVGTGRSDFDNQINNVLAFPGIFKGALEVRARYINLEMKMAAARAIADAIPTSELRTDYIIPKVFEKKVVDAVSEAVKNAAVESGVAK